MIGRFYPQIISLITFKFNVWSLFLLISKWCILWFTSKYLPNVHELVINVQIKWFICGDLGNQELSCTKGNNLTIKLFIHSKLPFLFIFVYYYDQWELANIEYNLGMDIVYTKSTRLRNYYMHDWHSSVRN